MNELPKVFQNKIDHDINNEQKTFVSFGDRNNYIGDTFISVKDIDNILNSKHHIIKSKVKIYLDGKIINTNIVSRNNNYIITYDNQKIPISSVKKIEVI